jgi:hypothetical protein
LTRPPAARRGRRLLALARAHTMRRLRSQRLAAGCTSNHRNCTRGQPPVRTGNPLHLSFLLGVSFPFVWSQKAGAPARVPAEARAVFQRSPRCETACTLCRPLPAQQSFCRGAPPPQGVPPCTSTQLPHFCWGGLFWQRKHQLCCPCRVFAVCVPKVALAPCAPGLARHSRLSPAPGPTPVRLPRPYLFMPLDCLVSCTHRLHARDPILEDA